MAAVPASPTVDPTDDEAAPTAGVVGWFTLERTAMATMLALAFAIAMRPATDNDTWWHLRTGQRFVALHHGLGKDPFSHVSTITRPPSDWLGQVGMYLTWKVAGFNGVAVGVAVLATLGCALVAASTRGPGLLRAAMVGLTAATSSVFWSARPQMVSFFGSCLVVWVLARARRGVLPPWWLALAFVVWSNTHLGWFYGLAVLWAAVAGVVADRLLDRRWAGRPAAPDGWPRGPSGEGVFRRLVGVSVACTVACFVNPVGWNGPHLILTQISVATGYVEESQPPSLHDAKDLPFFLLLLITAAVVVLCRRRVRLAELVPLLMLTAVALTAVRTVTLFAAAAAPFVSWHLADRWAERRTTDDRPARSGTAPGFNLMLLGAIAVFAAVLSVQRVGDAATARSLEEYPVASTAWVRKHRPPGPLFNTFNWGGWFIWHLPDYPVSIDGRAELYVTPLQTYGALEDGIGVPAVLDRQRDNLAVVPTASPLDRAIAHDPAWHRVHRDSVATVFVRTHPLAPR